VGLLAVVFVSAIVLFVAYRTYGGLLSRLLQLDPRAKTPAMELRDDVDYAPLDARSLLGQHFSAIAAAGPIVGPILAGAMFGWLPALIWILVGAIFVGGVHDMTALVSSIRHRALSIAHVVRQHVSGLSHVLFLLFIWFALIYVIVAFTDITSASFIEVIRLDHDEQVLGSGIASASLMYLLLPIVMGLLMKFARLALLPATLIFVPLVGVSIWAGQHAPLDLASLVGNDPRATQKLWNVLLLIYCFVASIVPMWILLQPRGHLGGYFMYITLFGGALGLVVTGVRGILSGVEPIQYPAFRGWTGPEGQPLFPFLFITVACGACSGFHSMVASGTTSKQLKNETDAKAVGYGAMLLEAMVAVVSLCCVMILAADSAEFKRPGGARANVLYAQGIGSFFEVLGVPIAFAVSFAMMAFTTFIYDTLDVCTRLGRYIVQELIGWHSRAGGYVATAITVIVPMVFLLRDSVNANGVAVPVWRTFWGLFGASNQLLAALTLLGVTVWLWRTRRVMWVWLVTGLPAAAMYIISSTELIRIVRNGFAKGLSTDLVPWVAVLLMALAALMLAEVLRVIFAGSAPPPRKQAAIASVTA
jgi:carbon starvation protein